MGGPEVPVLPTGFAAIDEALGIGGLPLGHIVEIYGPASSGKTGFALQCVAHLQALGGAAAWIDAERAFDARFAASLGVNLTDVPVVTPGSAEEALEIARRLAASGAVDLVVIDSAAALAPSLEMESGVGRASLQGDVLASELRRLARVAARSTVCMLFLNQSRMRLEGTEGETSAGGPPLKLRAAVRIALSASGRMVRFRVLKNHLGPAFGAGQLEWRRGEGFAEPR